MKQNFQFVRAHTNVSHINTGFRGFALAVENHYRGPVRGGVLGAMNFVNSEKTSKGVFAGLNNDSSSISGLTLGAFNILEEKNEGVVIGGYNDTEIFHGVIAGLMNVGEKASGIAVGLFNMADDFLGVQVGLLNVRSNAPWYSRYVPIVAIRLGGARFPRFH